jgi:hypothetical protein
MRVDGIPGVRTCSTKVEKGMVVESEGGVPSTRVDLLSVIDHVFRKQFDYHSRFIRPKVLVPTFQKVVRSLASPRTIPDRSWTYSSLEELEVGVLVVGHGASGAAACDRLRSLGMTPFVVDRRGTADHPPSLAFACFEDGRIGTVCEDGGLILSAEAVLLATGRIETGFDLVNADLPGVMLPEALGHLVARGVRPGRDVFVIGSGSPLEETVRNIEAAGCNFAGRCEDPGKVVRIVGARHVKAVELMSDEGQIRRVKCDCVLLLGPLVPYVNLAQQAGCELACVGEFWCVKTDRDGITSVPSVFSCGGATGLSAKDEREASGVRAAESIARLLGVL